MKFERINLNLNRKDNKQAIKKSEKELGIKSLSFLVRQLIKRYIKEVNKPLLNINGLDSFVKDF